MKQENIEELLEQSGLTKSEAKLYLTSLKVGPASAIDLGKRMGLTRQMIYNLLPGLTQKGLMKEVEYGGRRVYQAMGPEALSDRAKNIQQDIEKLVPILKSHQATANALPLITVYENPISMREWYRQFMAEARTGEDYLIWSTGKDSYWWDMDAEFYGKYLNRSEEIGVKQYLIAPNNEDSRQHQKTVGRKNTEWKFIDNTWETDAEKWIWRDQICYLTIRENATNMVVIQSEALAAIERFDFWKIWDASN